MFPYTPMFLRWSLIQHWARWTIYLTLNADITTKHLSVEHLRFVQRLWWTFPNKEYISRRKGLFTNHSQTNKQKAMCGEYICWIIYSQWIIQPTLLKDLLFFSSYIKIFFFFMTAMDTNVISDWCFSYCQLFCLAHKVNSGSTLFSHWSFDSEVNDNFNHTARPNASGWQV